jgi:hypothetical protein
MLIELDESGACCPLRRNHQHLVCLEHPPDRHNRLLHLLIPDRPARNTLEALHKVLVDCDEHILHAHCVLGCYVHWLESATRVELEQGVGLLAVQEQLILGAVLLLDWSEGFAF